MAILVTQHAFQRGFVFWLAAGETVCQVTACQLRTMNGRRFRLFYPGEISRASLARTFNDSDLLRVTIVDFIRLLN
ncbi:Uncharacterised protein [Escherichia coli]|uniref:Uncharacterized protein n=1 Tax=Escherichia coli TaxID=562 RepID=A0A376U8J9_ECOLX|nr:Uncharacterised protein [Escherichia coli]